MPSADAFPIGAAVRLVDLSVDPYPILRRLHMHEPVSWVPEFQMWFVTSRTDVIAVLTDYKTFTTGGPDSTIRDIFGPQMLTLDGEEHRRFKSGSVATFHPKAICKHAGTVIRANVHALIDGFIRERAADLRTRFANRLSILTIAAILGFPAKDENCIRDWYNAFAGALANFLGDPEIRRCGLNAARELRDYTMPLLHQFAREPDESLLSSLVHADSDRLSNDEILANALIILFGGIETTESMILNAIWALLTHPEQFHEVVSDRTLLPGAIEESLRWEPAVQSCTRTATDRTTIRDVKINQGDTVSRLVMRGIFVWVQTWLGWKRRSDWICCLIGCRDSNWMPSARYRRGVTSFGSRRRCGLGGNEDRREAIRDRQSAKKRLEIGDLCF